MASITSVGKNLNPSEWTVIENNMVTADFSIPSRAVSLSQEYVTTPHAYLSPVGDSSFSHQMHDLTKPDEGIAPDAYVLTANSAVPIASAVRGYFAAAGKAEPALTHVAINRNNSDDFYYGVQRDQYRRSFSDEISRLKTVLEGVRHVAVIDQLIASGLTVKFAGALLHAAGIPQISAIRGCWYYGIEPDEIDLKRLRCTDEKTDAFMFEIGRKAYAAAQQLELVDK